MNRLRDALGENRFIGFSCRRRPDDLAVRYRWVGYSPVSSTTSAPGAFVLTDSMPFLALAFVV